LSFNRICPAYQGIIHHRKLQFTHVKIFISPSSPNGSHITPFPTITFQNPRAILKESAKERYITEPLINFTLSPSSIPFLASSSTTPLTASTITPNYQTFGRKKKLHKCPTKNTCKRRNKKKTPLSTKPNKATYSKVSTEEKKS